MRKDDIYNEKKVVDIELFTPHPRFWIHFEKSHPYFDLIRFCFDFKESKHKILQRIKRFYEFALHFNQSWKLCIQTSDKFYYSFFVGVITTKIIILFLSIL